MKYRPKVVKAFGSCTLAARDTVKNGQAGSDLLSKKRKVKFEAFGRLF